MASSSYIPLFELASGGMGAVTLGMRRHQDFERLYAIKRLRGAAAEDEDIRRMFLEEARVAGLLRHPNVVSVLDMGTDEEGPFLIMEWIDGVPLQTFLRVAAGEGPIPAGLVCRLMAQVARGLHAAHELRTHTGKPLPLVHRDVSPSNILVGFDGLVRVTDFGIAKALGGTSTTGQGILKGKFGYMSPEQLRFDELDQRSDLFALGVVLFETLSAARLYGGHPTVEETARKILREPPPSIGERRRDVPPELEELIFELLAKTPGARPSTAKEVADRLESIARDLNEDISLEEYVRERFGDAKEAMSKRIARALAAAHNAPADLAKSIEALPREPSKTRSLPWLWVALALLLPSAAAAAYFMNSEEPPPPVDVQGSSAPAETPQVSALEAEAEAEGETAQSSEVGMEVVSVEEPTPEPTESAMRTRTRMRRRARRPQKNRTPRPGEGGWHAP